MNENHWAYRVSLIGQLITLIFTGKWAWKYIQPENLWGGIKFLILWSILTTIAGFVWYVITWILFLISRIFK